MIHPSYADLMNVVNSSIEEGEHPVVQSRYSIVLATSKRAREIIAGDEPLIDKTEGVKPLSIAVQELYEGKLKILSEEEAMEKSAARAAKTDKDETETAQEKKTAAIEETAATEETASKEEIDEMEAVQ